MTTELLGKILSAVLAVALVLLLTRQCRKPTWLPGRLIARLMNAQHAGVTDWGLTHVSLGKHFTMLDVGCGGGRTIRELATSASEGKVYGIDYSAASVATARRTNARLLDAGRVDIQQGTVSRLPFPDRTFDLVTAVETHYYWPDLVADLGEIQRVLKPGGRMLIVAETYKRRSNDALYRPAMKLLRATYLSASEHRDVLVAAGYAEVEVFEERSKGWLCAVGRRPAPSAACAEGVPVR